MGIVQSLPSGGPRYTVPHPVLADDRFDAFECGNVALDDWLKRRALKNEGKASRTYVLCNALGEDVGAVVGYYTLSAGAVRIEDSPGWARRNMPNPLPVFVLGRLAVDHRHSGKGLARGLMKDALQRSLEASRTVGARALIVHAADDGVIPFYAQFGFQTFPTDSRTMFLPIDTIGAAL